MTCSKIIKLLIIGCLCAGHDQNPIPIRSEPTCAPPGKQTRRSKGRIRQLWKRLTGYRLGGTFVLAVIGLFFFTVTRLILMVMGRADAELTGLGWAGIAARHRLLRRIAGAILLLTGIGMCLACYTARTVFLTNLPPFLPPAGRELHSSATSFRMAAFGDFGAKVDSMEAVIRSIGGKADFTICTGDMMKFAREAEYGHVVSELREEMKGPFWAIPGNHDLGLLNSLETWHRFFGQDFYYWSYGDTLFIALNTAEGKMLEDQRIFLKQTLSSQRERYQRCVILCHIPPVDLRPKASHCLPAEEVEAFRKIISGYKIDLIVSGHIHQYMEGTFAGIRLVHLPSSGQVIRDPNNRMFGYAMFDFKADGTIQVKQVDVTAETGRERLEFFASTVLGDKTVIFLIGLALIVIGIMLLNEFVSGRVSPSE